MWKEMTMMFGTSITAEITYSKGGKLQKFSS